MAEIKDEMLSVEELSKKLAAAEKRAAKAEKKLAEVEKAEEAEKAAAETAANALKGEQSIKEVLEAEEKVEIRLFKDNNMYKDDVSIGINGYTYLIKRGVPVMVPKSVAEIIKSCESGRYLDSVKMEQAGSKVTDEALM